VEVIRIKSYPDKIDRWLCVFILGETPPLPVDPNQRSADWNPQTNFGFTVTDGVARLKHFNLPLKLYNQKEDTYALLMMCWVVC
jgi:hypothetical protein